MLIGLLDGRVKYSRIPKILRPLLKVASISSVLVQTHTFNGIWDFSHLSLWNFQMIGRSLLFNSSGNLNTATSSVIVLIYLRNQHRQRASFRSKNWNFGPSR